MKLKKRIDKFNNPAANIFISVNQLLNIDN